MFTTIRPGRDYDVAVSTRVRLARNLDGLPFPGKASARQAEECAQRVRGAIEGGALAARGYEFIDFGRIPPEQAAAYAEEHLASPDFLRGGPGRLLAVCDANCTAIMVNEEDHLRMQCFLPGNEPDTAAKTISAVDDELSRALPFAHDPELGYLTACVTNLGAAMRVSVMLHLPALLATGALQQVAPQLARLGLTLRGMWGEGSEADGNLYQLSNLGSFGSGEQEWVDKLSSAAGQLIALEREARQNIYKANTAALTDRVRRALGTLMYAYSLSSGEFFKLYSELRLGAALGIITDVRLETLDGLLYSIMPASLARAAGDPAILTDEAKRDQYRAAYVKRAVEEGK